MKRKKRKLDVKKLITFVGIIVVLTIILSIGLASYFDKKILAENSPSYGDGNLYEINEIAKIGNLEVSIYMVENITVADLNSADNNYILIYWEMKNNSNSKKLVLPSDFLLYSNEGQFVVSNNSYKFSDLGINKELRINEGEKVKLVTAFKTASTTSEIDYTIQFTDIVKAKFTLK